MKHVKRLQAASARALGKTTLLQIVVQCFGNHAIFVDVSKVIAWHIENNTRWGRKLAKFRNEQASGKILPSDLVMPALEHRIKLIEKEFRGHHGRAPRLLALAGGPRDDVQRGWMNKKWDPAQLTVHIKGSFDDVMYGVALRDFVNRSPRIDSHIDSVQRSFDDYKAMTVPAIEDEIMERPDHVLEMPKPHQTACGIAGAIKKIIDKLDLSPADKERCLRELYNPFGLPQTTINGIVLNNERFAGHVEKHAAKTSPHGQRMGAKRTVIFRKLSTAPVPMTASMAPAT